MHVLIVDNDTAFCEAATTALSGDTFVFSVVRDGTDGLDAALSGRFDALVLDVVLPSLGGLQLIRQLRSVSQLPVIIVSERADRTDRIVGLELGADDYIAKPCDLQELGARLRAIRRRSRPLADTVTVNGVTLRSASRSVTCDGRPISLTTAEFDLLSKLMRAAGRVLTRQQLAGKGTNGAGRLGDRSIDMHISWLRRKLGGHRTKARIKTIHRVGYQFLREDPRLPSTLVESRQIADEGECDLVTVSAGDPATDQP